MLTARGWWFAIAIACVTLVGVGGLGWWSATIPLIGLTLAAWFIAEWLLFAASLRSISGQFEIHRSVYQSDREVQTVWARGTHTVRVEIRVRTGSSLTVVEVEDALAADFTSGPAPESRRARGPLGPDQPLMIKYENRSDYPGVLRFEGVQVRVADACGFFYRRLFIRAATELLVLPSMVDERGRRSGRKRFNALPPPGLHRLRRPGNGSELLDLRDYQPGDPPKLIAWRASARRDKLITREFESEVPVRCQLFLDASNGPRSRNAPGPSPLARLADACAAVAQAGMGNRDLVGVTIFTDEQSTTLRPARTASHLVRFMQMLAEAAGRLPASGSLTLGDAIARAYPVARKYYPELLDPAINSRPLALFWLPAADSRIFPFLIALMAWPVVMFQPAVLSAVTRVANSISVEGRSWQTVLAMLVTPGLLAGMLWLIHGLRGLLPGRARTTSQRKQLAALYAHLDHQGAGAIEHYLNDDVSFADRTSRFLAKHRIDFPSLKLSGTDGGTAVLARSIIAAVSQARDNELYVLFLDPNSVEPLEPLLKAARVARTRRHQLLVLTPAPVMPPDHLRTFADAACQAYYLRTKQKLAEIRSQFATAGVPVVLIDVDDPARVVLEQLDRLRGVTTR